MIIVTMDLNFENISSLFKPVVQLCACENGGNCTTDGLLDIDYRSVVLNCDVLEVRSMHVYRCTY